MTGLLLVLCQPADPVAERFAAHARAHGRRCALIQDAHSVALSAHATREGRIEASLRAPGEDGAVGAVFNRAYPQNGEAHYFQAAEWFAAWWSILAVLPRPVLNRPARGGYMPLLDPFQLCRAVHGLRPAPGLLSAAPAREQAAGGEDGARELLPGGGIQLSGQPQPVLRLLVAGRRLFDLDSPTGEPAPADAARVEPLLAELRRREATFCAISLALAGSDLVLVEASAFPHLEAFLHRERAVYDALLEYLDGPDGAPSTHGPA